MYNYAYGAHTGQTGMRCPFITSSARCLEAGVSTGCSHWADSYALCLEHFFITISGNLGFAYGAHARLNTSIIVRRLIHAVPLKLLPHTGTCGTVTGSRLIHAVPLNVLLHNGMYGISDV